MKKILGLDLGVASIGWAIVNENDETLELVKSGVRVIPIDTETSTNYSKGASTSKNQDRRMKRAARRNNQRYKLRKHRLADFLKTHNLWPIPAELFHLSALELYGLRNKALDSKITLPELARIWFHLNQKRGYIDSRKGASEEDKDTKYVEKIKESSKNIYTEFRTVGSYFYNKLLKNSIYRIKSGDDKENIFLIEDYKLEFDLIWKKQREYYPELLTDSNYEDIRNKIIYYKRRLKSQKHLIGECQFEKHHKSMPISSPIAEEIRLWQDINNLRITSKYNEIFLLTSDQKNDLFSYLMSNEKITEKELLKRYQYPSSKNEYKINFEKQVKGNVYRAKLLKAFSIHNSDFSVFINFDALEKDFEKHPYFRLWHLLYATEEAADLKATLTKYYGFTNELIDSLLKIPIKSDFASLSSRAARKLLPHLRSGKMYSEACELAGYNHSNSISKPENLVRELLPISKLELIKPNELRNPTVEKILNQLINLLKGLNSEGHEFDEIRIELARDLKKNAKERQRITKQNTENEKNNKDIIDLLINEHGFKTVSKKDLEKYKLWKEFDQRSPYEPDKGIELEDLFDKAKYEIEHIIPKSRYFDDSLNNKTIARVHVNKEKDNATAFDYMSTKGEETFHQYQEFIKHAKISETKRKYFKMSSKDIPEDFISRQLNETRYITKHTLDLLKKVCRNVYSTSGSVTDYLRHHWGYDNVLMDLNFDRVAPEEISIKEKNGQKRKVINNWTKRLDHRHHAVDAIVIACTKQSYIQQLNKLNTLFEHTQDLKPISIKTKFPFDYEHVKKSIDNILVSFKAGKKVATIKTVKADKWGRKAGNFGQKTLVPRGTLHEESVYGENKRFSAPIEIKKLKNLEQCAVEWQKEVLSEHIRKYDNDLSVAINNLKKDPVTYEGNKILDKVIVYLTEHVKRYNLQYSPTNKFDLKAAQSIVNDNVKRIVIARLEANENDPAKAFKNLKENPLYFNKEKNIQIHSVRCYTGGSGYPALHESSKGSTLNSKAGQKLIDKKPVDFVKGGNNHHIAIYEDDKGNRIEKCVTFFEAFERKQLGISVIEKNHPNGYRFITSLQQNEMFVFGMKRDELKDAIEQDNFAVISKRLFRVRKFTEGNYWFNHHLETQPKESVKDKQIGKAVFASKSSMNGIKVKISITNMISIVND